MIASMPTPNLYEFFEKGASTPETISTLSTLYQSSSAQVGLAALVVRWVGGFVSTQAVSCLSRAGLRSLAPLRAANEMYHVAWMRKKHFELRGQTVYRQRPGFARCNVSLECCKFLFAT